MDQQDWKTILTDTQEQIYKKDTLLLEQGTSPNKLFQVIRGSCRVQTKVPSISVFESDQPEPTLLGYIYASETFGEINFLLGGTAIASVYADEDNTSICAVDGHWLRVLFVKKPLLASKFFLYLSKIVLDRAKKRELLYY